MGGDIPLPLSDTYAGSLSNIACTLSCTAASNHLEGSEASLMCRCARLGPFVARHISSYGGGGGVSFEFASRVMAMWQQSPNEPEERW